MTVALFPGSFDPPTHGHLDALTRATTLFDRVVIGVVHNPSKTPLFTAEERVAILTELLSGHPSVTVRSFTGLLVSFAREIGAGVIVKGIRGIGDFDYELTMAQMNRTLTGIDTVFVPTSPEYGYLSSSLVREVARLGGAVDDLVPASVARSLKEKLR
jgi:pantetheine-phosphate adenylyltransferase